MPPLKLGVYGMNDETEIPMMPLSHGLFPFLLILCFTSFRFPSSDYVYFSLLDSCF